MALEVNSVAVIGDDQIGFAAPRDDRVEFSRHPATRERGVGDRRQAFLDDVVGRG